MRPTIAERRFPVTLMILFALAGIAAAVTIGHVVAPDAGQTVTGQPARH
jgi:hypothetical protein